SNHRPPSLPFLCRCRKKPLQVAAPILNNTSVEGSGQIGPIVSKPPPVPPAKKMPAALNVVPVGTLNAATVVGPPWAATRVKPPCVVNEDCKTLAVSVCVAASSMAPAGNTKKQSGAVIPKNTGFAEPLLNVVLPVVKKAPLAEVKFNDRAS